LTSDNKHSGGKYGGGIISLIIAAFFLYLAFRNVDLEKAFSILENVSFFWLLVFIAIFLLTNFVRAVRWKVILRNVKRDASLLNLFAAMMIGYGVNSVVPRLGEIYRAFFLGKWEGLSRTSMFGTVIIERLIDILALFFSVFVSVLIYSGDIYTRISWLKATLITGGIISGAFLFGIIIIVLSGEKSYSLVIKFVAKFSPRFSEKLREFFASLVEGFASVKGTKTVVGIAVLTALIMLLYGLNSYVGFYLLGLQNSYDVSYSTAWILMTISAFGIVIPTPGGIGSYHAIVIFVLTALFGFSSDESAAYAILTHFISYFGFIFLAVVFLFLANKRQQKLGFSKQNFWSVLKREN
jgi:uncharacterized protein (TIRG00374 family)